MRSNQPIQLPVCQEVLHQQEALSVSSVLLVHIVHLVPYLPIHLVLLGLMRMRHPQQSAQLVLQVLFARLHHNLQLCVKMEHSVRAML